MAKKPPSAKISPQKAGQILSDGTVRGKPLTPPQRGMFGAAAGRGSAPKAPKPQKAPKPRPAPMAIGERPVGAKPRTAKVRKMMGM
jgi:hypothetical protein